MRQFAIAGVLLASLAAPALAAPATPAAGDTSENYSYAAKDHWAVQDTVGNCAVLDAKPSRDLKILGDKSGYTSIAAADREIKSAGSACRSVVSRA